MTQKFVNHSLFRARNGEHFEFYSAFASWFTQDVIDTLALNSIYAEFSQLFAKEQVIISTIRKYEETAKIQELDHQRDELYSYIVQYVKNSLRSPIEQEKSAAIILEPIFESHSKAGSETQIGETGTLLALLDDLKINHSKELTDIGLLVAVEKLDAINKEFQSLLQSRDDKSQYRKEISNMKNVRKEVDQKHTEIINLLNGMWLVLNMNADAEKEKIAILNNLSIHLNSHANELFNNLKERHKRNADN